VVNHTLSLNRNVSLHSGEQVIAFQ